MSEKFKGIIVSEDEFVKSVEFDSEAELEAFSSGLGTGADLYGAGSCGLYTLKDLETLEWDEVEESYSDNKYIRLIKEHLLK